MTAEMSEDPTAGIREAARRFEDARVELQQEVHEARERGVPWALIGEALGVRKQTAWERFGKP